MEPFNPKEIGAKVVFKVLIRDRTHFYKIVHWLNDNVGEGSENWRMEGRPLRNLIEGPITRHVYIYVDGFDSSCSMYLNLI